MTKKQDQIQDALTELEHLVIDTSRAWEADDGVDTNLGEDVQRAGEKLLALLQLAVEQGQNPAPVDTTSLRDPGKNPQVTDPLHGEVERLAVDLESAVRHYGESAEPDARTAGDVYALLAPGVILANRAFLVRPR